MKTVDGFIQECKAVFSARKSCPQAWKILESKDCKGTVSGPGGLKETKVVLLSIKARRFTDLRLSFHLLRRKSALSPCKNLAKSPGRHQKCLSQRIVCRYTDRTTILEIRCMMSASSLTPYCGATGISYTCCRVEGSVRSYLGSLAMSLHNTSRV